MELRHLHIEVLSNKGKPPTPFCLLPPTVAYTVYITFFVLPMDWNERAEAAHRADSLVWSRKFNDA